MTGLRKGVGLLVAVALAGAPIVASPPAAGASGGFELCPVSPGDPDPGEAELGLTRETWKRLARSGVSHELVRPTRFLGGRPVYPVRSGSIDGSVTRARLSGGFRLVSRKGQRLKVVITRFVGNRSSARIEGRVAGRKMTIFRVEGSRLLLDSDTSRAEVLGGRTVMSPRFAALARKRAGLRQARGGLRWGGLYLTWIEIVEPEVEEPPIPDPFERPESATDLVGATLTWRVREKWVQYVASGDDPAPLDPAIAGAEETIAPHPPLIYEFTFPFSEGWVVDGPEGVVSASVKGSGGVSFRYCGSGGISKGINFVVRNPELEVEADQWRLIFEVEGVDGTPFTGSRSVVVEFDPSDVDPTDGGGGTTSWDAVPGAVPLGAVGVFGGFYGPGVEFGSVSLQIEREPQP